MNNLPSNFKWLLNLGTLPKMITEGMKLLGIQEIKGAKSNPEILKFAAEIGVQNIYKNDDTSWCAVAHNAVAQRAGKKIGGYKDTYDLLRALAFQRQGVDLNADDWDVVPIGQAMLGDTLIFKRPEGGHVGLYIGESATHYYVMGGNQNNMYSFTRIAKGRLVAVRRPQYSAAPVSVKKYQLNDTGVPVTTNEA